MTQMTSPFTRTARHRLLAAVLLALAVFLPLSCASGAESRSGSRDTAELPGGAVVPPGAEPGVPDTGGFETSEPGTPLRFPRLSEDPEEIARSQTQGPAGNEDEAGVPGAGDIPGADPTRPAAHLPLTNPLIEDLLDSLTLRQRIGQRFITHVPGSRITYGAGRAIAEVAPAGFIIYPWNFETTNDLRSLTTSLQDFAQAVTPGIGLLICADQEGGRVATLRSSEVTRLPSARVLGGLARETGGEALEAATYLNGLHMMDLGLNMNLAPVLDVTDAEAGTIIGDRSYSGDAGEVVAVVEPYLRGADRAGLISVAKHFPGHGVTTVDSHSSLPVVEIDLNELRERDLLPFGAAINAGVDVVMTAHVLYETIDPFYPATLSRVFVSDLLRGEMGFDGVVMSDGLEMGAIRDNFSLPEALVRMFRHDVDLILLFVNYDIVEIVDQVEELIRLGEITTDDVDRGVRRVLRLKLEHGLANPEEL